MKNAILSALILIAALCFGGTDAKAACSGGTSTHACWYTTAGSNTAPYDTEAKACTTLAACITQMAAGDTLFVVNTSAGESLAVATNYPFPGTIAAPNRIYNVNTGGTTPTPGSAGAGVINSINGNSISFNGFFYWYGPYILAGTSAFNPALQFGNASGSQTIDGGTVGFGVSTSGGGLLRGNGVGSLRMLNTTVAFPSSSNAFFNFPRFVWKGGSLTGNASSVTGLFNIQGAESQFLIEGVDLSVLTSGNVVTANTTTPNNTVTFKDIKISSTAVLAGAQSTGPDNGSELNFIRTGSNAAGAANNSRITQAGTLVSITASSTPPVLRTGGATDGVTAVSWNVKTTSVASWSLPFTTFPLSVWNTTTGAKVSLTLEGIASTRDFGALPTNQQVWFDAEYLVDSGDPLGSFTTGTTSTDLASAVPLSASSAAWDGSATVWAATTAYSVGAVRKLAGCTGQLYEVTNIAGTGTSGGSQPACQSDGGSVIDNAGGNQITWAAMWRFNQTVQTAANVALVGPITVYPKVAISSLTDGIWLDPQPAIAGVTYARSFAVAPGVYDNALGGAAAASHVVGGF